MTDLSQSFNKLVNYMFLPIGGRLVERLPDGKFRWGNIVGTEEEIEKAIKESGIHLQNAINNSQKKQP